MKVKLKAGRFKTDKSQGMLDNYHRWFEHLQDKSVKLLEVGVLHGGSLQLWQAYFPKGIITGLDIKEVKLPSGNERIRIYQGLQQDEKLLKKIARENAPNGFDIIIDDASHQGELTRQTFLALFDKHLKQGGVYVIEDWGTGYWSSFPDGKQFNKRRAWKRRSFGKKFASHQHGMVGLVKQLVDEQGMGDITAKSLGSGTLRDPRFSRMEISRVQVAIFKKSKS